MSNIHPFNIGLSSGAFALAFPFHIIMDEDFFVVQIGHKINKLFSQIEVGQNISKIFSIQSPRINFSKDEFCEQLHTTFVLRYLSNSELSLKGQVIYEEEQAVFIFIGNPTFHTFDDLKKLGLTFQDFAIHNCINDFVFLIHTKDSLLEDTKKINDLLLEADQKLVVINSSLEKLVEQRTHILKQREAELELEITEHKKAEIELLKMKEHAEAANKAKSQFITNMSHEIRTPLTAIMGFNEQLLNKSRHTSLPEYFPEYLHNIGNSAQLLADIINNILDISKIEANKVNCINENFNLKELIRNIYTSHSIQAQKKHIKFTYYIAPNIPEYIFSDQIKIQQILINIIGNAMKFTHADNEIQFHTTQKHKHINFIVKDQGIGIPHNRQEMIFNKFEQVDDSTTRDYGGTGLGLAITKKLVQLMQGSIALESELGVGSIFTVSIPYREAISPPIKGKEIDQDFKFSRDNRVLVVEDNSINQMLIASLFEDLNITIQLAENGQVGIEKTMDLVAKGDAPDLIIMDLQMPVMGGIEAIEIMKSYDHLKNIPIIVLSADAFIEQQTEAASLGIQDYLTKPIEMKNLVPVLKKHLRF